MSDSTEHIRSAVKKQWDSNPSIKEWRQVGTVESLFIHPIKSMRGISVQNAEVWRSGLRQGLLVDRRMQVVRAKDNKVVSAIRAPKLVLINCSLTPINEHGIRLGLNAPNMEDLQVDLPSRQGSEAMDGGEEVSKWLTTYLSDSFEHPVRLLVHADHHGLAKGQEEADEDREDFFNTKRATLLLVSKTSLEEVHRRIERDFEEDQDLNLDVRRFRPNIVLKDVAKAFEEDDWRLVRVGEKVILQSTELCDRCTITTIEPEKGEKHQNGQPLKVLRTFRTSGDPVERRKYGSKAFFGTYFRVVETGSIRVDDTVYVAE